MPSLQNIIVTHYTGTQPDLSPIPGAVDFAGLTAAQAAPLRASALHHVFLGHQKSRTRPAAELLGLLSMDENSIKFKEKIGAGEGI